MKIITSSILEREGFVHGFGTRDSAKEDLPPHIHVLRQIHGDRIVCLEEQTMRVESGKWKVERENPNLIMRGLPEAPFRFEEGDALVTALPGIAVGVRTADCLPLLVGDPSTGAAAAVHCGWRSLDLDLPVKAVHAMIAEFGTSPTGLAAALGPTIGPCCYEVGPEVVERFRGYETDGEPYAVKDGRYYLDLRAITVSQLLKAGLDPGNIDDLAECVACQPERFFSYRGQKSTERMVSFITARGKVNQDEGVRRRRSKDRVRDE